MKTWIYKDKDGKIEKVEYKEDTRDLDKRDVIDCSLRACINPAVRWHESDFGYKHRCEKHIDEWPFNSSKSSFTYGPLRYDEQGPYRAYYDDMFWNDFDAMGLEETKSDFLMKVLRYCRPGWKLSQINSTATSNSQLSWTELDTDIQDIIIQFRTKAGYS